MTSAAGPAIATSGLTKRYGPRLALGDLDLEVERGEVFGYLGPNGAGKTTTIRLFLDLIRPSAGRARLLGLDSRRDSVAVRRQVGYLPGELVLYERLTVGELLTHFGHLRGGIPPADVAAIVERLQLEPSQPIHSLSKGNKQKVGLAQALVHRPALAILDEPTSGLDPLMQHVVQQLLLEARAEGRTVFLSSHVLSEVARVADRVGVLRAGRLVAVEDVAGLRAKALRNVVARFTTAVDPGAFDRVAGVTAASVRGDEAHLTVVGPMDPVVKALAGFHVVDLIVHEPDLEEIFLSLYGDAGGDPS
jgi:ABC-2 type transport system ATP-binding protein